MLLVLLVSCRERDSLSGIESTERDPIDSESAASSDTKPVEIEPQVCEHIVVIDEAVEATCTKDGISEGAHCEACEEVLIAQQIIPMTGHTVVVDEAIDATCTKTGLSEKSYCKTCGEVLTVQQIIPMISPTPRRT